MVSNLGLPSEHSVLMKDKFDIFILPIEWGNTGWIYEDTEEKRWFDFIINKTNHALRNKVPF